MFPLGTVLFPGALLPLQVFEPRYRELVRRCLDTEPEFGVVLIERGLEVGGGDVRSGLGTVARIVQLAEIGGGRYALVAVGTRRIRVRRWLPDAPYPLADVEDWDDEVPADDDESTYDEQAATAARLRRTLALAAEAGHQVASATTEISVDPIVASYHMASMAPLGPADAQRLLGAPGPAARFALLRELLDDVDAALTFRLGVGGGPGIDEG